MRRQLPDFAWAIYLATTVMLLWSIWAVGTAGQYQQEPAHCVPYAQPGGLYGSSCQELEVPRP